MGNVVTVEANNILGSSVAGGTYTAPTTPVKLALITTATASSATAAGSEVSGGSYARVSTASSWGTASAGSITNSAAFNFTGMPGPITLGGIELWDNAGTPVRRWFGVLGSSGSPVTKSVNAGDTVSFAIGAITITLS